MECLTGQVPDISPLLLYRFWEPVCYNAVDPGFPSEDVEKVGRFVGTAESVGHALTFKVFNEETQKIIPRSQI